MADAQLADDILRRLYSAAPEDFLSTRSALAAEAKEAGDAATAQAVAKLRKPTVAAWIVNSFVLDDPSAVARITELGDRLRTTQHALDAPALRELTAQRRSLVHDLTAAAFARAGRADPPVGLQDEVRGTLDAAVADPDVAARLGRLQRAESFSGFGFGTAANGPPWLTVIRGRGAAGAENGAGDQDADNATRAGRQPAAPARPRRTAAERRARQRAVTRARSEYDDAESAVGSAQSAEHDSAERVRRAERALAAAKASLEEARQDLDDARHQLREAKATRRATRQALDRAERDAED